MVSRVTETPADGVWNPSSAGVNPFIALSRRREGARVERDTQARAISQFLAQPFAANLAAADRRTLESLAGETNAEIFNESLLTFGRTQEAGGRLEAAAAVYAAVEAGAPNEALRNRARECSRVLHGGGSFGNQVEFAGRQLADQATNPVMLAGMGIAGLTFETVRLGVLSRLAVSPASWYSAGAGARVLAWSAGFAAEVPAFAFSIRGIRQALGHSQDWSGDAVGRELLSAALTLFALKVSGLGARSALARISGSEAASGWVLNASRSLLPQAAMFTGIWGAHHLETNLGLREATDARSALVQSLATLLQFNVSGRLLGGLTGPGYANYLNGLDARARAFTPRGPSAGRPWGFSPDPAFALGLKPLAMMGGEGPREALGLTMAMSSSESGRPSGSGFPGSSEPPASEGNAHDALFQRVKTQIDLSDRDITRLQMSKNAAASWGPTMRRAVQNILPLIGFIRENALTDPSLAATIPYLEDIIMELRSIEEHLDFGSLASRRGKVYFPQGETPEVQRFLTNIYRFNNTFMNYLDHNQSLTPALNHVRYAHNWLRVALNILDHSPQGRARRASDFPYVKTENGVFELPQSLLNVVVLGDEFGSRTADLAIRGHQVIHIDPNLNNLRMAQLALRRWEREGRADGRVTREVQVHYVHGDLQATRHDADLVEAYYPPVLENISPRSAPTRRAELQQFLDDYLNNKLAPRGSGFLLTERDDIVEDLVSLISESSQMYLLDSGRRTVFPPLLGGRAATAEKGEELVSWIVYRKRTPTTIPPPGDSTPTLIP